MGWIVAAIGADDGRLPQSAVEEFRKIAATWGFVNPRDGVHTGHLPRLPPAVTSPLEVLELLGGVPGELVGLGGVDGEGGVVVVGLPADLAFRNVGGEYHTPARRVLVRVKQPQ